MPCYFLSRPGVITKKGHLRQIEDSTKSMLLPARPTPTSLAQEANAPARPFAIGVWNLTPSPLPRRQAGSPSERGVLLRECQVSRHGGKKGFMDEVSHPCQRKDIFQPIAFFASAHQVGRVLAFSILLFFTGRFGFSRIVSLSGNL